MPWDLTVVALTQTAPGAIVVPAIATTPAISTDAATALVAWRAGAPWVVVVHDATRLQAGPVSLARPGRGQFYCAGWAGGATREVGALAWRRSVPLGEGLRGRFSTTGWACCQHLPGVAAPFRSARAAQRRFYCEPPREA